MLDHGLEHALRLVVAQVAEGFLPVARGQVSAPQLGDPDTAQDQPLLHRHAVMTHGLRKQTTDLVLIRRMEKGG